MDRDFAHEHKVLAASHRDMDSYGVEGGKLDG